MERRGGGAAIAALIAAAAAIRLNHIADRSLWLDEAGSWRMSRFPWSEFMSRLRLENHPPLYFGMLKIWMAAFGDSPLALRSLSVLWGAAVVVGIYGFACEAFPKRGRSIGLAAAAAACVWPTYVYWGMNARMYTLGTALTVFSSWALFRAINARGRAWGRWLCFAGLALAAMHTHYFAILSVAAQFLFLGVLLLREGRWRSERANGALAALALVASGWLPWAAAFSRQWARVENSWWISRLTLGTLFQDWSCLACPHLDARPALPILIAAGLLLTAALAAAAWRGGEGGLYCAMAVLVPFGVGTAASAKGSNLMSDPYFQFMQPFVFVAFAAAALLAPARALRWCVGISMAVLGGLAVSVDARELHELDVPPGIRAAAEYLRENRRPGDLVISHDYFYMDLVYYSRGDCRCLLYEPDGVMPHYRGSALLDGSDKIIDRQALENLRGMRVFVVNADQRGVPQPPGWKRLDEIVFPSPLGDDRVIVTTAQISR